MKAGVIRPLAIGIFRRGDAILVFEGYDPSTDEVFYRPLGGAIEFSERGYETVAREVREEIGAEARDLRYLGLCENIFDYDGKPGHEIVLVYEGVLADPALYRQDQFVGHEDDGQAFKALWKSLDDFRRGESLLYPDDLLGLLDAAPCVEGKGSTKTD